MTGDLNAYIQILKHREKLKEEEKNNRGEILELHLHLQSNGKVEVI